MKITDIENPITVVEPHDFPDTGLPEFVFIGRSNVGKSSFINTLLGRKQLAYTSSNPGKTQTLNFYKINQLMYFVDVPGYGYAKVSKKQREAFGQMIETYLTTRESLHHAFLLIDFRHDPTEDDQLMANYFLEVGIPFTVIGTKSDKVSKNKRIKHTKNIREVLGVSKEVEVIPFSAMTADNKDIVLGKISHLVASFNA